MIGLTGHVDFGPLLFEQPSEFDSDLQVEFALGQPGRDAAGAVGAAVGRPLPDVAGVGDDDRDGEGRIGGEDRGGEQERAKKDSEGHRCSSGRVYFTSDLILGEPGLRQLDGIPATAYPADRFTTWGVAPWT